MPDQAPSVPASFDGARILANARELAFPRYPGTEGDRRAIDIVSRWLREAGLDVRRESFSYDLRPALRALRAVLIGSAALVFGAAWLAGHVPWLALLLLGLGATLGGLLLAWSPGAERLYARPGPTVTANVVGRRRSPRPRMTLILLAHHDSKSQSLNLPLRLGATILAIGGTVLLAVPLAAGALAGRVPGPSWWPLVAGGTAGLALLALSTLRSGNESPGGVDNAGSVAIVAELARVLPGAIAQDVELVFLSTGAEEDHMVGAMRWLDAHRAELASRPVYALNLDGAGAPGRVVLIERYGFGRRFSPRLSRVAVETAARLGLRPRRIWMPPAIGIDAIPFAHRGLDCLTFSSGSPGRAAVAVHSAGDVADHLDADVLQRVAGLVAGVAVALAAAPSP